MYKKVLIFLAGALIGTGFTYLFIKDKYEKIVEEEIQSVKDEYAKTYEAKKKIEVLKEAKNEIVNKVMNRASESPKVSYAKAFENKETSINNYNIFSNPLPKIENDDEIEYEDHPKEGIASTPYTISPKLFVEDKKYFDKITLEYYEGNDMLVEEITNEPIDIDYAIGRESLRMFGEFEKDLVYVRNERISTDFEVYHYSGSFNPD